MARIIDKIWKNKKDVPIVQIAYAIAVCETILDPNNHRFQISEQSVKPKILKNLVSSKIVMKLSCKSGKYLIKILFYFQERLSKDKFLSEEGGETEGSVESVSEKNEGMESEKNEDRRANEEGPFTLKVPIEYYENNISKEYSDSDTSGDEKIKSMRPKYKPQYKPQ